jgi:hypothetical protein
VRWGALLGLVAAIALASTGVLAQPSTGALPPVPPDSSATPSAAPPPTTSAPAVPTATQPAAATPTAAPPTAATPPATPPPAYPAPYPPPPAYGYGTPPPAAPEPPPPHRSVTLSFSPIHLIFPLFEATAEVRAVDHFGISAIGGFGSVPISYSDGTGDRLSAYELGGQLVVYPWNDFDGVQFGVELLYLHLSGENLSNADVKAAGEGLAVGPLVGYKLVTLAGFTFFAQGGFEYIAARAETNDTSGNSSSASDSRLIPLLNLNIGWSF